MQDFVDPLKEWKDRQKDSGESAAGKCEPSADTEPERDFQAEEGWRLTAFTGWFLHCRWLGWLLFFCGHVSPRLVLWLLLSQPLLLTCNGNGESCGCSVSDKEWCFTVISRGLNLIYSYHSYR